MPAVWTSGSHRKDHNIGECIAHLWEMFSPGSTSDASLLAAIGDENIDSFQNKLQGISRRMLTLKNARLPIMRLPMEILCIVFRMVQIAGNMEEVASESPSRTAGRDLIYLPFLVSVKWIYVTHVCSHWREVALSCPSLWTHISTTSAWTTDGYRTRPLPLLKASLKRSGDALINMRIRLEDVPSVTMTESIDMLLPHLPRCKELHLFSDTETVLASLDDIQMPHLRVLCVHITSRQGRLELPFITPSSINYLSLADYELLSRYSFGNLKQLRIHSKAFDNLQKMESFLGALEANYLLEDILFDETLFHFQGEDKELGSQSRAFPRQIRMPNLRTIAFHDIRRPFRDREDLNLCTGFLAHIILPPQLALTVTANRTYNLLDNMFSCAVIGRSPIITEVSAIAIAIRLNQRCDILCAGSSLAWFVEDCGLDIDAPRNYPGALHSARQLWLSSSVESDYCQYGIPTLWFWLRTHHFEEVILTLGLNDSQWAMRWFFEPFDDVAAYSDVIPYAQVRTLRVHGAHSKLWKRLLVFLQHRKLLGRPIRTLTFVCRKEAPREEREVFEDWKRRVPQATELRSVEQVEFIDVDEYPRPQLPPVCAPRDHGPWKWFDWPVIGDIGSG